MKRRQLWDRILVVGECWEFQGANDGCDGYGRYWKDGKYVAAHREAFRLANGYEAIGDVCHSCDNPPCIRPEHLFDGGDRNTTNTADRHSKSRDARGERQGLSKLSELDVYVIRASLESNSKLAIRYDISKHAIWCVRNYKTWKHVT